MPRAHDIDTKPISNAIAHKIEWYLKRRSVIPVEMRLYFHISMNNTLIIYPADVYLGVFVYGNAIIGENS